MPFAHGATGSIGVQGYAQGASLPATLVVLAITSWECEYSKPIHDTSNTSVPGYTVGQPGKATAKVTVEAKLDLAANPLKAASGPDLQADYCYAMLVAGSTVGGSATTPSTVASPLTNTMFQIPQLIISSFKITNNEGDIVTYSISGQSSGNFTINNGS